MLLQPHAADRAGRSSRCRRASPKMPFWRFTVFSLIGCLPWVLGLAIAGHAVGSDWKSVRKSFEYVDYAIVALVVVGHRLRRRAPAAANAASRRAMPPAERTLALRHAVALGLLQGPVELLPISSSGHTALIPWLAGWPYAELDGELRKSFEVALHAGAGVALAIDMRGAAAGARPRAWTLRRACMLALSLAPPVSPGFTLRGRIERQLGGPRSIAVGLTVGAIAMAIADTREARGSSEQTRAAVDAGPADGLALGLAQASALIPGVSRNGATLTAARARGFDREGAHALSWSVALPVILGASALKGARLLSDGVPRQARGGLALGGRERVRLDARQRCASCASARRRSAASLLALPVPAGAAWCWRACAASGGPPRDPARHADRRALPARRGDRARRHVDGVPRVRHGARAAGGDQADAPRDRHRLRPARALPARGALGGAAQPSARGHRDRRRRGALRRGARRGRRGTATEVEPPTSCSSTSKARRSRT